MIEWLPKRVGATRTRASFPSYIWQVRHCPPSTRVARSPLVRYNPMRPFCLPWQIKPVRLVISVHAVGHIDDDGLGRADVLPAMVQVGRDDQEAGVFLAHHEFVVTSECRRGFPAIEHDDLDEAGDDEQSIGCPLMQPPSAHSTTERRG